MVLTLGVGKSNSKSLGLWLSLTDISGSVPNPTTVASNVGGELHVRNNCEIVSLEARDSLRNFEHTVVVGTDLQSLVSSHNQSRLAVLLVLQESNITSSTLLPLVGFLDKFEELCAHLESLLLQLLISFNLHFLGETDDWLEVNILGLWCFFLLKLSVSKWYPYS